MTLADAARLIGGLRQSGVEIEAVGDHIRVRPTNAVSPDLLDQLAACKPGLLAILHEEAVRHGAGDGERPSLTRCPACEQRDFVRPRAGGAWRCARCRPYDLPSTEIEWWPRIEGVLVPLEEAFGPEQPSPVPTRPCWSCKGAEFWRLKPAGGWTCSRCHPPQPPPEGIETTTVAEVDG